MDKLFGNIADTFTETISNAEGFSGLRPHILGLISIFNGKPLKIEEKGYSLSDEGMKAQTSEIATGQTSNNAFVSSGVLGCTPWLRAFGKLDKIRFSLDLRRNHLKRRRFLGLKPSHPWLGLYFYLLRK